MHLLAREETGLRCLLRVALEGRAGSPVPIARIARSEAISGVYAAKLMRQLRLAGLVDSTRGAAGGYQLARPADKITVWDAIQALDESFLPAAPCDCEPRDRVDCRRTTDCAISSLWRRLGDQIRMELSAVSLDALCGGSLEQPGHTRLPVAIASPETARDATAQERLRTTAPTTPASTASTERTSTWPSWT